MSVADLIQHNCADRKKAKLSITNAGQEAHLYFENGEVVHASLGAQEGEEVVYSILAWEDGSFSLTNEVDSPKNSINRSWSGLLMEGAKRLDEQNLEDEEEISDQNKYREEPFMTQRMDEILQEMSAELNGFTASAVTGMDGISIAQVTDSKLNPESVAAQLTVFLKLAGTSNEKSGIGVMEDILIQTDKYFIMNIFLPGDNQHYLTTIIERKSGSLGNLRLISKIYADRLSKVIPR